MPALKIGDTVKVRKPARIVLDDDGGGYHFVTGFELVTIQTEEQLRHFSENTAPQQPTNG